MTSENAAIRVGPQVLSCREIAAGCLFVVAVDVLRRQLMWLPVVVQILERLCPGSSWMRLMAPASLWSACDTLHSLPDLPLKRNGPCPFHLQIVLPKRGKSERAVLGGVALVPGSDVQVVHQVRDCWQRFLVARSFRAEF
jgi:hypothetical protein